MEQAEEQAERVLVAQPLLEPVYVPEEDEATLWEGAREGVREVETVALPQRVPEAEVETVPQLLPLREPEDDTEEEGLFD